MARVVLRVHPRRRLNIAAYARHGPSFVCVGCIPWRDDGGDGDHERADDGIDGDHERVDDGADGCGHLVSCAATMRRHGVCSSSLQPVAV